MKKTPQALTNSQLQDLLVAQEWPTFQHKYMAQAINWAITSCRVSGVVVMAIRGLGRDGVLALIDTLAGDNLTMDRIPRLLIARFDPA